MSKRFLFITPVFSDFSGLRNYSNPNLGIWRISAYLEKHGIENNVHDFDLEPVTAEQFIERYSSNPPDIIGISVLNSNLIPTIDFINAIGDEFPLTDFILGGAEATLNYQELFDKCRFVNGVCLGEGERVCYDLAMNIDKGSIKGIIWRNHAEKITDSSLWEYWNNIDFSKLGYEKYWQQMESYYENPNLDEIRTVRLITSSHCPKKCNFCSVAIIHDFACGERVKPAYLSAEQIGILLARIKKQIPTTRTIYACEDDLLSSPQRNNELIPIFQKHEFIYLIQTFSSRLSEQMVNDLAKANVRHITCGIECVSNRVRKLMGKPQNPEHIEQIIDWCLKYRINPYFLIILFPPEIIYDELIETAETLNRWIKKGVTISIEPFLMPYKGAKLFSSSYEMAYKQDFLANGEAIKYPYLIFPEDRRVRQIMAKFRQGWNDYLQQTIKKENQKHLFKGYTGRVMVEYLNKLLEEG